MKVVGCNVNQAKRCEMTQNYTFGPEPTAILCETLCFHHRKTLRGRGRVFQLSGSEALRTFRADHLPRVGPRRRIDLIQPPAPTKRPAVSDPLMSYEGVMVRCPTAGKRAPGPAMSFYDGNKVLRKKWQWVPDRKCIFESFS